MDSELCYLMHRNVPVISFYINDGGMCCGIEEVYNHKMLPPGTGNGEDISSINWWLSQRQLKGGRADIERLKSLKVFDPSLFMPQHFISAFDCYWVRGAKENDLTFEKVTFYNKTEEDMHNMMDVFTYQRTFDSDEDIVITRDSPNMSINSSVPILIMFTEEGMRVLIQASLFDKSVALQEKYADNEDFDVLAGIYSDFGDSVYYDIPNITNEKREYIPFEGYYRDSSALPENVGKSPEELFIDCIERLNVPEGNTFISWMLTLDSKYGIDRKLTEFGVLRDKNLNITSFAPLFCYPVKKQLI